MKKKENNLSFYSFSSTIKYYTLIFTFLILANCSKNEDKVLIPDNAIFNPQTELISLTETNNIIALQWKPVIIKKFLKYKIYRLDSHNNTYFTPNKIVFSGKLIKEIDNHLLNSFTDSNIPFNSFIGYAVVTEYLDDEDTIKSTISINHKSHENVHLSFEIISLEKQNDGTLKILWEKDENMNFNEYTVHIYKTNYTISNSSSDLIVKNGIPFTPIKNQNNNFFIDDALHKNKHLLYAVSKKINGKTIYSKNYLSINNPRSFDFKPSQILKNPYKNNELILLNPAGEIVFFDINTLEIKSKIELNSKLFHSSIASYKNIEDLYIPSENGKIYIVNLNDYNIKEVIDLDTDHNIISAIPIDNHILFIEKHFYNHVTTGGRFVYDRVNKTVLNRDGSYTTHLNSKLFKAFDNYFFYLTWNGLEHQNSSATRKLSVSGKNVSIDFSFNKSRIDSKLFVLSPDKTYFISSNFGHQSEIDYQNHSETTVGQYNNSSIFGDAKISSNNKIYFAVPKMNSIYVYNKGNFNTTEQKYPVSSTPLFIELFENKIISINMFEGGYYLEKINL